MTKFTTVLLLINFTFISASNIRAEQSKQMALINDISFFNSKFDKSNVGNGFLINVNGNDFAITAKHILMIAKTDKMEFVNISGEIKQWKMFDKNNEEKHLVIDKLLNTNKTEKLEWNNLSNDWIVFSIKENKTGYKPLNFRTKPLTKGEKLFVVGWSYEDKLGPQRTYEFKYDATKDGFHSLIQIQGPKSLAGLSGSPIIDENNKVIGLVSTGWKNEETNVTYLQASKANDIQNFIEKYSIK